MTVDKEHVRRDAEQLKVALDRLRAMKETGLAQAFTAADGAAVLAEIERLRRVASGKQQERDVAESRAEQAERERDEFSLKYSRTAHDLIEAEARLASVPALVEALHEISEIDQDEWHATHGWKCLEFVRERARAALAAYEQSQGNTE